MLIDADWCLLSDVMPNSCRQAHAADAGTVPFFMYLAFHNEYPCLGLDFDHFSRIPQPHAAARTLCAMSCGETVGSTC